MRSLVDEAAVPVTYKCFAGTIHSFMILAGVIDLGHAALLPIARLVFVLTMRFALDKHAGRGGKNPVAGSVGTRTEHVLLAALETPLL
jgi:hypothetical protein